MQNHAEEQPTVRSEDLILTKLRLDCRTAIVTGAGGNPSMGRAHALLLASHGANVVVNDIGDPGTRGYSGTASAEAVAQKNQYNGARQTGSSCSIRPLSHCPTESRCCSRNFARVGDGGNNALTINTDHSVGAGHVSIAPTPDPGPMVWFAVYEEDWVKDDDDWKIKHHRIFCLWPDREVADVFANPMVPIAIG
jgi:hypothetical protein